MPYFSTKYELEVLSEKDVEEERPEGIRYPALIVKGDFDFSHLPSDTHTVIVWELGGKDIFGKRDKNVYRIYEKILDKWVIVY